MKNFTLLLSLFALLASCSDDAVPNDPGPAYTVHKRDYNEAVGGPQIVEIWPNQAENKARFGWEDEVLVIQTNRKTSLEFNTLYAGDSGQYYPLPASIEVGKLYVYTKTNHSAYGQEHPLRLNTWIWNNSEPDTARLINDLGTTISEMTYDGK